MARRRTAVTKPRLVVIIGHNQQVVQTVTTFIGGRVPVFVYTTESEIEVQLAPYPDVTVAILPDYDTCPADLPDTAYFICLDSEEEAKNIREWLPQSRAIFHIGSGADTTRRSGRKNNNGLLHLQESNSATRRQLFRRLSNLRRVDKLMDMARNTELPLILMYSNPDPDAIGAALALATIWRAAGANPIIRYTGEVQRYQNKLLISYLKEPIEFAREAELAGADLVAIVDAQPGFWRENQPRAHVIIDHHPRKESSVAAYTDIREDYGSTATIMTEYLVDADLPISRTLATALLYGLKTDTNDLQRNTRSNDVKAYDILHTRSDQHFISRLVHSQVPMNMLDYLAWGISNRIVVRDMMLVHFGDIPHSDILVQCADYLLLTCGINWVVCAGKTNDKLIVTFRGDGHKQDVGRRAHNAFGRLGSAGGHRTMGRAEVPLDGEHEDASVDILVANLFKRMSQSRQQKIIRALRNRLHGPEPEEASLAELI